MPNESLREAQHRQITETLEVAAEFCNDWELVFLGSILEWTENSPLTVKQESVLGRLYQQACALPESRAKLRKPKPEKKKSARRMSAEEAWNRAPTPQTGDEEILF